LSSTSLFARSPRAPCSMMDARFIISANASSAAAASEAFP